ncbi:hypothetical protein [Actinoplanes sp. GCM10030250]|uniref:hypothetical protein n=1 Tax=Actinoplanes sp. GCM10030250 TaxID=3273376 RepID=UPI00361B9534
MAGPRFAERLADALLSIAARRWPADFRDALRAEWAAESASLRGNPRRMLTFAGSLAAASPPGADWAARAAAATGAALIVLVSAGLFNGVRLALHHAETALPWSGEAVLMCTLLGASVLVMALAGARWAVRRPVRATLLTGLSAYAFVLAGNEKAVMPFMGWRDITPAVVTWTAAMALTGWGASRLRATGHHRTAAVTAVGGGLLAVEAAAVAGCLHAAFVLGVPLGSAPAWFPLAMLPGGTGGFGTYFPAGSAAAGSLPFHASDILLAGAATLTGPLLLCTAFLTAAMLRTSAPGPFRALSRVRSHALSLARSHALPIARSRALPFARFRLLTWKRIDPQIVAGGATAAVVLTLAGWLPRSTTAVELVLPRVVDNSTVFGFGFLAYPAGRAALAFAAALLVVHHFAAKDPHLVR